MLSVQLSSIKSLSLLAGTSLQDGDHQVHSGNDKFISGVCGTFVGPFKEVLVHSLL